MEGKRIVTMRPKEGLFSLSIEGAKRIVQAAPMAKCLVVVQENVSKFVAEGGDVFARHVIWADNEIRAEDEVIVVDKASRVLAVGRASLSSEEMKAFRRGVAVKVRRGYMDEG
jgi:predicted RNA-binding protein (TIGR00451 family)